MCPKRFTPPLCFFSILVSLSVIAIAQEQPDGAATSVGSISDLKNSPLDNWNINEPPPRPTGGAHLVSQGLSNFSRIRYRTPAMLGDFFGGTPVGFRGESVLDRLVVIADDLDAPLVLPPGGNVLSISEPGPVGIFSTSIGSLQEFQALLRAGAPIPGFSLEGIIDADATLTTLNSISEIQSQLAGSGLGYDIIVLAAPPGSYDAAVAATFQSRNAIPGSTVYNSASSGALIQGGGDTLNGGEDLDAFYFYDYILRFHTGLPDAGSGGVGRSKIAQNGSVLPQNRVFMRYDHITNTRFANGRPDLNQFMPGLERAFMDGLFSLEFRFPFATDAMNTYSLDNGSITSGQRSRFGNLTVYSKALLLDRETFAFSGGLGVTCPTASDTRVHYANGTPLLHIANEAVYLQPFLGMLYTPNANTFAQAFVQYDIAASSNSVAINSGNGLAHAGKLTDANHLFLSGQLGHWIYRDRGSRGLTGIVPTLEAHHTVATDRGDMVVAGPFQIGNFNGTTSFTSLVAATTLEFGTRSHFTFGYATAIGNDRQYDSAFQFQWNRLIGP